MVALIEELGCGDEYDRLPLPNRTTPKMRNLLQQAVRRQPTRTDLEGNLVSESIIRHAARHLPSQPTFGSNRFSTTPSLPSVADFIASLAVDGWNVQDGQLIPMTPVSLVEPISRLKSNLDASGFTDARTRLEQLEHGLDDGHWESANADARAFLSAVFAAIAKQGLGQDFEEGLARKALVEGGFFKRDPRNTNSSLEGDFVQKLMGLLGSEGAHAGASDQATAIYRYGIAALTADYFLCRHRATYP